MAFLKWALGPLGMSEVLLPLIKAYVSHNMHFFTLKEDSGETSMQDNVSMLSFFMLLCSFVFMLLFCHHVQLYCSVLQSRLVFCEICTDLKSRTFSAVNS